MHKKSRNGIALVEAIIAVGMVFLTLIGSITTFNLYVKSWSDNLYNLQAAYILNEGAEIVYVLRDKNWSNIANLSTGSKYYLSWSGGTWVTTATPSQIDGTYDRYVIFENAYRDVNGNIAASGSLENGGRKATVYVGWLNKNATTTISASTYVFNIFND